MNKDELKNIPISAFNESGWLKPNLWVYLNLVILAKGLLIFIASLASRGTGDQILSVFFPEKTMLYIAIALSIVPLATLVSLTLGEVQKHLAIKRACFLICTMQVAAELSLTVKAVIADYHPFESTQFKFLIVYIFILLFSFASFKTRLFLNQIIEGKGVLEKETKESQEENEHDKADENKHNFPSSS